jgi:translation initiation factor IF-1
MFHQASKKPRSLGGACREFLSGVEFLIIMSENAIQTIGKILGNLNPILYRVELQNGKMILAHLSKPLTEASAKFSPQDHVILEMTPFDFDQARILGIAE